MINIKQYFKKYKKNRKGKQLTKPKIIINQKKQETFTRRRKQLSLNIKKVNFISIGKNKNAIILFLLFFLVGTIAFIIFGPYFKITHINIIKQDEITDPTIAYKSIESIRGKSMFNLDKNNIFEKFTSYQQNIDDMKIKKIYPNTLKITLSSYPGIFNTINTKTQKEYIILKNGTLIPSKPNKDLKTLKIVNNTDKLLDNFVDYKKIYKENYISSMENIIKRIEENIIDLKIDNLTYYVVERELHIKTNNNLLIYTLNENINQQIEKTVIFYKEYPNIFKKGIYYTDLRINGKIFYCLMEEEQKCIQNLKSIY